MASTLEGLFSHIIGGPVAADFASPVATLSFIAGDVAHTLTTAPPVQPTNAPPEAQFSAIYAFGDSLTDAGNVSLASLDVVPVSPPYARVFSTGPVWVQDVAQHFGLPAIQPSLAGGTDFAYGGAQTGQLPDHTLNPTDLTAQIGQFSVQVASPQPNALYAIWIGSNDVLGIANDSSLTPEQQQADVRAAVTNEVAAIQTLASRGAHEFVVLNVPDLGQTPYERARPTTTATATSLSALYDNELATAIKGLEASGAVKIDLVDTFGLLHQAMANPSAYGFTDVTTPAWTGNLVDPTSGTLSPDSSTHLYFDGLHPTAQAHALLASAVDQSLVA